MEGIVRVEQDDLDGCGIAVVAMILRTTYRHATSLLPPDCATNGTHTDDIDACLLRHGIRFVRVCKDHLPIRKNWPPKPWARLHWCVVHCNPDSGAHAVVMLQDGTVFDPSVHGTERLSPDHYDEVRRITALYLKSDPIWIKCRVRLLSWYRMLI